MKTLQPHNFEDLDIEQGGYRVTWEWLGEGQCGDYNPNDPADTPLLRFSCWQQSVSEDTDWIELDDSSYCTLMPIGTPVPVLAWMAGRILQEIRDSPEAYRRRLQELSWCEPDWFENRNGVPKSGDADFNVPEAKDEDFHD